MNTLQFYLNETARKHGYKSINSAIVSDGGKNRMLVINEAATIYAEEASKEQRILCSENATADIVIFKMINGVKNMPYAVVNKESILNAPLAVNTEKV